MRVLREMSMTDVKEEGEEIRTRQGVAWAISAVYTVDDEGLEQDGAVLGLADGFVNHTWSSGSPRENQGEGRSKGGRTRGRDELDGHGGGRQRRRPVSSSEHQAPLISR